MNRRSLCLPPFLLWVCTLLLSTNTVYAGSQNSGELTPDAVAERVKFSKVVERYLAKRQVEVAIVGRQGRPRSELPQGINFTHVGLAVYSMVTTNDGRQVPAYVFHNLYQSVDDAARSELVIDSAPDFFASTRKSKAGILIPDIRLQRSLKRLLMSEHYAALHRAEYSVIANPVNLKYQNCTEFVLDLVTAAIYQTHDKFKIKANQRAYFVATTIKMSRAKAALGAIFSRGISLSDQDDNIKTATFGSIAEYLQRHSALQGATTLCSVAESATTGCDVIP